MRSIGATTRRVVRNSLLNLVAGVSQRLGHAVVFILVARFLSDKDTGAYNLANSYTSVLLAFSLWGLDQLLIREIAKRRDAVEQYLGRFLILRLFLAVLLCAALALLLPALPYATTTKQLIFIMALTVIPGSVSNLYQAVWIGIEEVRGISALMLLVSVLRTAAGAFLLASGQSIIAIGYLFLALSVVEMVATIWWTERQWPGRKLNWQIDLPFWLENLRIATPLIIVSLVLIVEYQFDVLILSIFHQEAEVGVYGKAATVLTLLLFLTRSYQLAVFPVISRAFEENRTYLQHVYSQSLKYLSGGALFVGVLVFVSAGVIVALLYGPDTGDTVTILRILVGAFIISAFNVPHSRLLIAADQQRVLAYFAIASMLGNLMLSLALVPQLGGIGTAIARVSAMPLFSIPTFLYVQRHICRFSWKPPRLSAPDL